MKGRVGVSVPTTAQPVSRGLAGGCFGRFDPDSIDDAIWSMKIDGSELQRVDPWPNGAGFATDPNVSPDGKTLSFPRLRRLTDQPAAELRAC